MSLPDSNPTPCNQAGKYDITSYDTWTLQWPLRWWSYMEQTKRNGVSTLFIFSDWEIIWNSHSGQPLSQIHPSYTLCCSPTFLFDFMFSFFLVFRFTFPFESCYVSGLCYMSVWLHAHLWVISHVTCLSFFLTHHEMYLWWGVQGVLQGFIGFRVSVFVILACKEKCLYKRTHPPTF